MNKPKYSEFSIHDPEATKIKEFDNAATPTRLDLSPDISDKIRKSITIPDFEDREDTAIVSEMSRASSEPSEVDTTYTDDREDLTSFLSGLDKINNHIDDK